MIVNDPIGDMLTRIRNATMAHKSVVVLPFSKLKLAVATILSQEGYLAGVEKAGEKPNETLRLTIAYQGKESVITGLRRVSKPGMRWYISKRKIPMVMGGTGIAVVSTPMGVMTGKDAKGKGLGGELICEVW